MAVVTKQTQVKTQGGEGTAEEDAGERLAGQGPGRNERESSCSGFTCLIGICPKQFGKPRGLFLVDWLVLVF